MIKTVEDIQKLLLSGETNWRQYGEVGTVEYGDLILFNYLPTVIEYDHVWNDFEIISRGLMFNKTTGEVVARSFDKFFNWLQGGRKASGHIVTITEKMDGSLLLLYRDNGEFKFATKGSFTSEQAKWGTEKIKDYDLSDLPNEWTLIFEAIYPGNRIVVDYKDRNSLVLLAIRNRFTGEFLPFFPTVYETAQKYGFELPQVYNFSNAEAIIAKCGEINEDEEGYVVEFSDGSRWKFKGDRYLELHKVISHLSFKSVVKAMLNGELKRWRENLPDEFADQIKTWEETALNYADKNSKAIYQAYAQAPKTLADGKVARKQFAKWLQNNIDKHWHMYFFKLYDGKSLADIQRMLIEPFQYSDENLKKNFTFDAGQYLLGEIHAGMQSMINKIEQLS